MKGFGKMPLVGMAVVTRRSQTLGFAVVRRFMSTPTGNVEHKPMGYLPKKQGMYDPTMEKDNCGVGMIANLRKDESHRIVKNALQVLERMAHRGGCGCEVNTGDGSGILVTVPHTFYAAEMKKQGVELPGRGEYGTGLVFFSQKQALRDKCVKVVEEWCEKKGFTVLGWRSVPTDNSTIGPSALACEPVVQQLFVAPKTKMEPTMLDTELMILRRLFERDIAEKFAKEGETDFYPCTLSSRTIVYKGMLTPEQVREYFVDLKNESFETYLALVHSRFSTNTFPSWNRAQPMRMLCHNGEINTLKGNKNWMSARESVIESPKLGKARTQDMLPVIDKAQSDSGSYDNVLEFLYHGSDRSLAECMLMMIPEPWQNDGTISQERKDFYRFYSNVMEPWDGPAMIAFTNGDVIGATLDRNGLRPSRYYVTDKDGSGKAEEVILASEVGCLQDVISVPSIVERGRLRPGQIFMVDLVKGELVRDNELKKQIAGNAPYKEWSNKMITMDKVLESAPKIPEDERQMRATNRLLTAHGYTSEALDTIVTPMGATGKEALGSMGNDAPLACLSLKPRLLYEYFKQLFAQVTNPPVDPLRESLVMSLRLPLGPEGNLLAKNGEQSTRIELDYPLLGLDEMYALKHLNYQGYTCKTIDCTIPYPDPAKPPTKADFMKELERIETEAAQAVRDGFKLICLSDEKVGPTRAPIDSLLAVGCVHQFLIKQKLRTLVGLMLESGSAHQVHHYALLFGMGADAVCPYLCYHALFKARDEGRLGMKYTDAELTTRVKSAFDYGVRKVMAKMGISTMQSYHGAQIFEALGIHSEVMDRAFTGTPSRIGGIDFDIVLQDTLRYHHLAFPKDPEATGYVASYTAASRFAYAKDGMFDDGENKFSLPNLGDFHYRDGGELHYNAPEQMALLQEAARKNSREAYERYKMISHELVKGVTLRGQLTFDTSKVTPCSVDEVEPVSEIVKRFTTGAMSMGSISKETHESLGIAMNKLGAKSNTGEGGEEPSRLIDPVRSSAIKQIASGRFGVTSNYLTNAIQLQIKMAQGAKPGEGGELPGFKVSVDIGKMRHSTPGVGLISPPPHHDIYSIEDLAQLIYDLKCSNPKARISVKLVSEVGVGVVAAGVAKAKADHILISGHDGGTGAAQWGGIKSTGLPWELGLAEAHQTLVMNDLRSRVVVETDGQIKTGRDVVMAFLLGAEETGFSTAPLISLGCIMMRKCHLNVCPVGIATQDPELRKKFKGMPEHVVNFLWMVAEEVRETMASLGIKTVNELVGRSDLLMHDESLRNAKTKNLDLTPILTPAFKLPGLINPNAHTYNTQKQDHELEKHIDSTLILQAAKPALDHKKPVVIDSEIINIQRSAGTILSHEISKKYGEDGLPDDMITINFTGSSGQSAASFLTNGVTMNIIGDSNDGTAKGLCGGKVVVKPDPRNLERGYVAEDNIITGNVALYGATAGRAFFRGIAGERFAVRNSGAVTVVEGCGDHGLEYMTGGRCVIIGEVGKNFSAGMSGGIAWVYDPNGQLRYKANFAEPVRDFERLEGDAYEEELLGYLKEHVDATDSPVAKRIIDNWQTERDYFVQVYPLDYKRARKQAADADSWKGREEAPKQLSASELTSHAAQTATPTEQEVSTKFNKLRGFVEIERIPEPYREPEERLGDWGEIYTPVKAHDVERKRQSARCMDCGTPFCQTHSGCPIHNLMPEWNELVFKEQWKSALDRLLTTNNFPEFTGRVCPAPCEGACVAGLVAAPVTIKNIEYSIIDRGFQEGWVKARIPKERSGANIAVVGSGPAGLAAADELNQMGHKVTVFERDQKPGGLMMYGIPNMKLDKRVVQRRIELLQAEGVDFICGVEVGKGPVTAAALRAKFDAVLLATGAVIPRDLSIPGREAKNIHFAMDFLGKQQRALFNQNEGLMENAINFKTPFKGNKDWKLEFDGSFIDVRGQRVVVIGGGDTGTDCTATSIRQGCKSLVNLELMDKPPDSRDDIANAWPAYPRIFRTDYGQEEVKKRDGKDPRKYAVMTKEFIKDEAGNVTGVKIVSLKVERDANGKPSIAEIEGSEQLIEADTVILAMGFLGPDPNLTKDFGTAVTPQTNIKALHGSNGEGFVTSEPGVFAAGDCRRGQSLVVWAINEGQRAADAVNRYILESRAKQAIQAAADGVKSGRLGQRGFHTSAAPLPKEE